MQSIDRDALELAGPQARWPARLRALATSWRMADVPRLREPIRAEFWGLLNQALQRYIRLHARRHGGLCFEDIVDLASDKAIDLMGRMESRAWDPAIENDERMAAFLSTVARNGVVDRIRRRSREHGGLIVSIATAPASGRRRAADPGDGIEASIDGGRYARALVDCARGLTARARQAWLLRVFAGLTSAEIATHPRVRTSVGGVHLMLNRCRRCLRQCLVSKGFEPGRMPAGTFVALWELVDGDRLAEASHRPEENRS